MKFKTLLQTMSFPNIKVSVLTGVVKYRITVFISKKRIMAMNLTKKPNKKKSR